MELQTPYRSPVNQVLAQEASRAFLARVYGWMFAGLAVSGAVSLLATTNETLMMLVIRQPLISLGVMLAFTWFVTPKLAEMSPAAAGGLFMVYASMMGVFLSPIFLVYELGSISRTFFLSATMFGALSIFALKTKQDLSPMRTFLFMGMWGWFALAMIQFFWPSPMLNFLVGCIGVTVFAGLTAYDTQKLKAFGAEAESRGLRGMAIAGALQLYLDFINLFLSLLRLLGNRR